MFESLLFDLMIIVMLGMASQWLAWRFRMPAIVIMSVVGLVVGPILGLIYPKETLGELFSPLISLAVAIILFEGSLNLNFKEIQLFNKPVTRIVTVGAFIAWIAGSLAAHYVAGLSWAVAFIIGGLFIVTGPTVILPLLRQARLKPRPAAILKWEGIVVDPFGALLAVFAYEFIKFLNSEVTVTTLLLFFAASLFAVLLGAGAGWLTGRSFEKGRVPEFLKAPLLFALVIFTFVISDEVMHETGLLAVTAMGIMMANMKLTSLEDILEFKENISVLLISTIFIMLTASLSPEVLLQIFEPNIIFYVLVMLFIVRPLSIWVSTIGTELTWEERTLIGWIAPRGIVALTVSGYFATILLEDGYQDAEMLTALTFALVFSTVLVHGFSIGWLAKKLNLTMPEDTGVAIAGSTRFTAELAKSIQSTGNKVLVIDDTWANLTYARKQEVPYYQGDILLEPYDHHLDLTPYRHIAAMSKSDTLNAHVCEDFMPEHGRDNLYQTAFHVRDEEFHPSRGGRELFVPSLSISELDNRIVSGYTIRQTKLTDQYNYTNYLRERDDETVLLYIVRHDQTIEFYTPDKEMTAAPGDTIVALVSPRQTIEKVHERVDEATEEHVPYEVVEEKVEESFEEEMKEKTIPGEAPPKE